MSKDESGNAGEDRGPLLARLIARIARAGPLTTAQYMAACLADARQGYWQKPASIGARGDFITAPEISQIFGELIGLWCAVVWQSLGSPARVCLVELGPGRGTMLRDALRAAAAVPGFLDAASVHLIEASPPLLAMQRHTLMTMPGRAPSAIWHPTLDGVPEGPAIILANEFLDALPIRQLIFSEGAWRERLVTSDGDGLRFCCGPKIDPGMALGVTPEPGMICELRAAEEELFGELARRSAPLVGLFCDYGPAEEAVGDTLQALRGHAYCDPLSWPGEADLTAHVRFACLRRKAVAAGFAADGPMPQAEFLGRLGIAERAARLMAANPGRAGELEAAVARLMSPTGMGAMVKVLAVRSPHLPPPAAFA